MISIFAQKLLWVFFRPLFKIIFNFKISNEKKLKNIESSVILISNHKSIMDPFFLGAALPFSSVLWPLRFMADTRNFKTPLLSFFARIGLLNIAYKITGAYPAFKRAGLEKSLAIPKEILEKEEGTVFMFIEGEKVLHDGLGEGRRGAAALALLSRKQILPMVVRNTLALKPYNFFRKKIEVEFGDPFTVPDLSSGKDETYKTETEYIMKKLGELYYKKN